MNLKSPLRRTAVLTAGALIGLSGAFALTGPASAHHNEVAGTAVCDTKTGDWTVDWTVNAISGGNAPTYQWTKVELTPADTTIDNSDISKNGKDLVDGKALTGKQIVPGKETSATLKVAAKWSNGHEAEKTGEVTFAGECKKTPTDNPSTPTDNPSTPSEEPSTPTDNPSTPPEVPSDLPGEPGAVYEIDCTTMTIGLDNPADGTKITLKYETSKGEKRTLVINPGEKKSETFSATPGFSVKLTFSAVVQGKPFTETTTLEYEQPEDCDGSGGGGGLPLTGAAAGSIAGGAGVLLAVGAGLFFMARRRKVNFTA